MASASSLPCEDQLLCSICLDVFTEPVSTPCGHNYCKTCITGYWSSCNPIQCPLCKKRFHKRPKLQVNTGFRDMVEHFKKMRMRVEDDTPASPGEVTCDICLEPKLRAQKTCLVCLASYCQSHLEPHERVKTLKKHQLVEPVSNLEDRVCKTHDRMFEFFCREDQMYICVMCLKEEHVTHEAVPLEQAFRERKAQLDNLTSEIKSMENTISRKIKDIKYFVKQRKKDSEKEIAEIAEVFTALIASLLRSQAELIQVIQEKQKAAEEEAEDRVTPLKQEVAELREKRLEMEKLLQTEDPLRFLQSCPVLSFPDHSVIGKALSQSTEPVDLSDITQQSYVGMVKKAVTQLEKTLNNKMQMVINKVRLSDGCEADEESDTNEEQTTDRLGEEKWTPPRDKLMMIQQNDAVDVTMDHYTANSKLAVSDDGKQLRFREGLPSLSVLFGRRFQNLPCVLGKEGFSSGRFYFEVRVSESKSFILGVVKESIKRDRLDISPEAGYWTAGGFLHIEGPLLFAKPDIPSFRVLFQRPQKIGVFVDYEKGEVSFYNVDTRTLLSSYTECNFMETQPFLKSLLYSLAGTSASTRPKLYPFFGLSENKDEDEDEYEYEDDLDNMLEITPVAHTT